MAAGACTVQRMKKRVLVVAAVALAASACGGGSEGDGPMTDAICADLANGVTPMQLFGDDALRGNRDGGEFRDFLRRHAQIGCPDQVELYADYFNA